MAKWTKRTATTALKRNGHSVKGKVVKLKRAGIGMLGAADYLRCNHSFRVFYD